MADFKQSIAILCLLLPCVVSKLINLDPEEILPGITPKLTINCSLTHNNVPDLTVINSLTLSRYNVANHEFDVVLSLDTTTLSVQQFVERQEAEITSGSQFLALTLHNPTQNDAEIYRCNVNGANAFGKNQSIKEKSKVEVLNNLTTYVEEMMRLRKVETELVNMKSKETCSPTYNSKKENSRLNFRGNSKIVKEYIQPLSLKCSFQVSTIGTDQNFTVHFMKIFHETQGVIASISEDQVIKTMEDIRLGEVQGKLSDQEGLDSYLQISWTNPSVAQSGNYFCEALAVHDENKNNTFNVSLAVLVEKPTYEDLVRILGDLLPQVEDVKDTLKTNKQELIKSTSDIKKFIYNFTIDQSLIENKFNNDIFDIKDDLRKALANFYLEQSSFRKKIDEDVYGIKDEIKKHLDKLSSAQSSLQNEIDRGDLWNRIKFATSVQFKSLVIKLSEMRNNIERFISNVNSTQALYSKRLDKVILGLPFSPPKSCRDIYSTEDRVVVTLASGLNVMCDTKTDGGGWIIFQRRINGKVDFYRGWKEYRDGFGDYLIGEFYLGNEKISMLTSKLHYEMRVDLAYENTKYFATFSTFKLLGENYKYQLRLGHYNGTAGDSLKRQNFSFFTTFDRDNDIINENCALKRRGAWWYKDCSDSNLNGEWANNNQSAVYWDTVAEWKSATFTEMKIREYK